MQEQEKLQKEKDKYIKLDRRAQYDQYVKEFYLPEPNQNIAHSRSKSRSISKEKQNNSFGRDQRSSVSYLNSVTPGREQYETPRNFKNTQYKSVKVTKKAYNQVTPQNDLYSHKERMTNPTYAKNKAYKISSNNPQNLKRNMSFLAKQGEAIIKSDKITNKFDRMNQNYSERDKKGYINQHLNNNYIQNTPDQYQNNNKMNYNPNNLFRNTNNSNQMSDIEQIINQRTPQGQNPNGKNDYYNFLSKNILQNIKFGDEKNTFNSNL